jgi:hypothetical protein
MNNNQALTIIKQLIDQAIKAGVCPNLETTAAIAQAFDTIAKTLESNAQEKK